MALTPKMEAFCRAIVSGKNQSAAYRAAYDAENMAAATVNKRSGELMKNGAITGRIAELSKPAIEKVQIDAAWVLERLVTVATRCLQEEPVYDRDGNPTGEYTFNAAGVNKALELLSRHKGVMAFGADKTELTGKDGGPLEFAELSDTDRAAKLAALVAKANARKGK